MRTMIHKRPPLQSPALRKNRSCGISLRCFPSSLKMSLPAPPIPRSHLPLSAKVSILLSRYFLIITWIFSKDKNYFKRSMFYISLYVNPFSLHSHLRAAQFLFKVPAIISHATIFFRKPPFRIKPPKAEVGQAKN